MYAFCTSGIAVLLFPQWLLLFVVVADGYLTVKPENVASVIGSAVELKCGTSLTERVVWYVTCTNCPRSEQVRHPLNRRRIVESHRQYTLVIDSVTLADSAVYTCVDDNGHGEAAFAELTVLGSPSDISLPVCPSDTVVRVGDNVILRAATVPGNEVRWYRSTDTSQVQRVVYSGLEMDYNSLDERFDVVKTRPGQVELVIQRVRLADAGLYRARDERTQKEASANVVVIDPDTPSPLCLNQSESSIECTWNMKYRGRLLPAVKCEDYEGRVMDVDSPVDVTSGPNTVSFSLTLPANDPSRWPHRCRAEFRLKRCNEYFSTFSWTSEPVQLDLSDTASHERLHISGRNRAGNGEVNWMSARDKFDCRIFLVATVVVTSLLLVVVVTLSVSLCRRRRHRKSYQTQVIEPEESSGFQDQLTHSASLADDVESGVKNPTYSEITGLEYEKLSPPTSTDAVQIVQYERLLTTPQTT